MNRLLLAIHLLTTFYMTGVIWVVQVVHYPLFARVGEAGFARYAADHGRLITLVVAPAMVVELATGILLFLAPPAQLPRAALGAGLVLLGVIWLSTFFLQVPQHGILSSGFDGAAHGRLVGSNWIRTIAWTLRSTLLVWLLLRVLDR